MNYRKNQKTDYVVYSTESESRAVYRGNSSAAAHSVARSYPGSVVTFKNETAFNVYVTCR